MESIIEMPNDLEDLFVDMQFHREMTKWVVMDSFNKAVFGIASVSAESENEKHQLRVAKVLILQRFSSAIKEITVLFLRTYYTSVQFMEYLIEKLFKYEECDWAFVACILAVFEAIVTEEHRVAKELDNEECYVCCIHSRLLYPMNMIMDDIASWTYNHGGWGKISKITEVDEHHIGKLLTQFVNVVDKCPKYAV